MVGTGAAFTATPWGWELSVKSTYSPKLAHAPAAGPEDHDRSHHWLELLPPQPWPQLHDPHEPCHQLELLELGCDQAENGLNGALFVGGSFTAGVG